MCRSAPLYGPARCGTWARLSSVPRRPSEDACAARQRRETLMAAPEPRAPVRVQGFLARLRAATGQPLEAADAFGESFILSRLTEAVQWARKYSFFPYP